jgi:membrane protease YdiL (CAAX protease family)
VAAVSAVVIAPVIEELLFRGVLFAGLLSAGQSGWQLLPLLQHLPYCIGK